MTMPFVGEQVIYCDPKSVDHNALITAAWSETCVNVVFVSPDESETDSYGRQIKRNTSVSHASVPGVAHGNYWRCFQEAKREYRPPTAI